MSIVRISDLDTAIAWLECNEGDEGESDACKRVAAFLERERIKRLATKLATEAGITFKRAKAAVTARFRS
jgi:hypothetical protein